MVYIESPNTCITNLVPRGYFEKARLTAELRCPDRDDGPIARILWKTSRLLSTDKIGSYATEAAELRTRAELAKQNLISSGEGGMIPFLEEDEMDREEEEYSYDVLVPLYYR